MFCLFLFMYERERERERDSAVDIQELVYKLIFLSVFIPLCASLFFFFPYLTFSRTRSWRSAVGTRVELADSGSNKSGTRLKATC